MNDYKLIRTGPNTRHRLTARDTIRMHRTSRAFLAKTLATPDDGPTVVVTHHAPDPAALIDPYADLSWCYASNMTEMIEDYQPAVWVHGHVHRHRDDAIGNTRLIANPRGYPGEVTGFVPTFSIDAE
jgi:Icc-related predicted phosphoesterase